MTMPYLTSHQLAKQLLEGPDLPILLPPRTDEDHFDNPIITPAQAELDDESEVNVPVLLIDRKP